MGLRYLCLALLSVTAYVMAQTCSSGNPIAYMCRDGTVQGDMVTLDVSTAVGTGASNCSCSLQANTSGVIVQFDSYPQTSDCETLMWLQFQEKSIMFRCGAPLVAETTEKTTATITYILDDGATNPDSSYCMTFNGSTTSMNLVLTCFGLATSTTSVTAATTVSSTTSSTTTTTLPLTSSSTSMSPSTTTVKTDLSDSSNGSVTDETVTSTADSSQTTGTTPEVSTTTGEPVTFTASTDDIVTSTESQTTTQLGTINQMDNATSGTENVTTVNTTPVPTGQPGNTTSENVTSTGTTASTNVTTSGSKTTAAPKNVTVNTTLESNVTSVTTATPNNITSTADNKTGNITITTESPINATAPDNTSDNVTEVTTDVPHNVTITGSTTADNVTHLTTVTVIPDNVTTVADNTTSDNATAAVATTKRPAFWEPPDDYEAKPTKTSNLAIILPLVGILMVAFTIGIVIFVRRTRKAALLQRERSKEDANKNKTTTKPQGNPFLITNYHPVTQNGTTDQKNKTDEKETVINEKGNVKNSHKDSKYTEKDQRNTVKDTGNRTSEPNNHENTNKPAHHYKKNETQKAPKLYEPTGHEKEVLDNLELTSIFIEPDPQDPNRYFKKEDPGDWYRVIMKGKKPRDSDELGNTTDSKSGKKKNKSKSSKSASDSKSDVSSENKGSDRTHDRSKRRHKSKRDLDETMKSKSSVDSWDELDGTIAANNGTGNKASSAPNHQPRLVVSRPASESAPTAPSATPAARVIMSQPKPETAQDTGSQKLVQASPASSVARQPQTVQPARTASPGIGQQAGVAKQPQTVQPARTVSPGIGQQAGIAKQPQTVQQAGTGVGQQAGSRNVAVKRPDIVPPLRL